MSGHGRLLTLMVLLAITQAVAAKKPILESLHNLSVSGPGNIRAATESDICLFCHTSHAADALVPLWNKGKPGSIYQPYSSSTAKALAGQPTGSSLLCLSCHDGTIALGKTNNKGSIPMANGVSFLPPGSSRLGTDLSDDHPISFLYPDDPELVPPDALFGTVKLENGQVQCRSCHDPHNNQYGKFLVMPNDGGALCVTCHDKTFWDQSSHNTSIATWDNLGPDPWPESDRVTVADNGCQNCHTTHSAPKPERLLNHREEEDTCLGCHNGHVAQKDLQSEFMKYSRHPITATSEV
ncbi:MAG: cytochrome c3 family protein, partial [Gammaproteobacteria bacterium]|nr:cytochrome c3 family protein [Gammaproteobacteria bacterium]